MAMQSPLPRVSKSADHSAAAERVSQVSSEDLRQVVLAANADGIDLLRRGQAVMAFEQLKYAESVLVSNPEISADENELLALTCSNLGCYYRKAGLPRAALRYLGRAMRAEKSADPSVPQDACTLATTKLNACAALSGVGRHEEAEKLAVVAMQLLTPQDGAPPSREECSLLAVACHNLGAEREHLGQWAPAAVAYRQGSEVSRRVLGPKSPLTKTLQDRCAQALSKAERNPFLPRRPAGLQKRLQGSRLGSRQGRRPDTAPEAVGVRCPPLAGQGFVWEGLSDLLAPDGAVGQEVQREDAVAAAVTSPGDPTSRSLDKELAGAVPGELQEEYGEDDEEMRGRMLPNLSPSAPEERRSRVMFEQSQFDNANAGRRWSLSNPGSCQTSPGRYGHDGMDNQDIHEWNRHADARMRTCSDSIVASRSSAQRGSLTHRGSLRSGQPGEQY